MNLRGANVINLDAKGRLAIPTKYRDWLREECDAELVCTVDIASRNLLLYPLPEWLEVEKKLAQFSSTVPAERRMVRLLQGNARECDLDKAGRILLAPELRQHAGLEKKIVLVGQLNRFEIWDEQVWQQQLADDMAAALDETELTDNLKSFSL